MIPGLGGGPKQHSSAMVLRHNRKALPHKGSRPSEIRQAWLKFSINVKCTQRIRLGSGVVLCPPGRRCGIGILCYGARSRLPLSDDCVKLGPVVAAAEWERELGHPSWGSGSGKPPLHSGTKWASNNLNLNPSPH